VFADVNEDWLADHNEITEVMTRAFVILFAVMLVGSGSAIAEGDPDAGKSRSEVCALCHGATGITTNDLWPNLAGQGYAYVVKQLRDFRDGSRQDPVMEAMAKPLTDQDIEDLAGFYSSLSPAEPAAAEPVNGDIATGRRMSSLCISCHGTGASPNDAWPNLAGQKYAYLVKQLRAFHDGSRTDLQMKAIARTLSDKDIENIAAFYSDSKPSEAGSLALAELPAPVDATGTAASPIIASPEFFTPRPQPTRRYWADYLPEGKGREIVIEKCHGCHDSQRTIAFARSEEQWRNINESMVRRGSPLSHEELADLTEYFVKYFGFDSPPIPGPDGVPEVGMKPCTPDEWPKGSSDFRKDWNGDYTIWLSNQQGMSVDIIDPVTKKMVNRIECISAPDRAEFSRDGNTAYIPSRVEHNITVVDTRTGAIKAKIPVAGRPNTPSISRDFKKLYIAINPVRADEEKLGYVQILDTETLKITRTIETNGGIHYARLSPDGKILVAVGNRTDFINVYDTSTLELLYTNCCNVADIGDLVIEAGPDGSTSRILSGYAGFLGIVALDARTGKELTRVEYPACDLEGPTKGTMHPPATRKAYGFHGSEISRDGKDLWVQLGNVVFRYELPSLKYLGHVHLSQVDSTGRPYTPATEGARLTISPDGQKVYASRPGRSLLTVVDVKTMKEEALIPTGRYPLHMAIWPNGSTP